VSFAGAVTFPAGLMMADTITIAATSALAFTDSTRVTIGGVAAVILSHTAGVLKVVAGAPVAAGSKVVLTHLLLAGAVDMSLTATTTVAVASTVRGGSVSLSSATPNVGDTVTLTANGVVSFSVAAGSLSNVTVGGSPAWILSQTATQIKLISPRAAAGSAATITNVILLGSVPLPTLDAASTVTVTELNEPGNNSPATPSALTLYTDYYGSISSTDADDFISFTTTTGDSVRVELQWLTDADNDLYLLNAAGGGYCVLDNNCAAAGSSNPEHVNVRLAAATTYQFDVNNYAAGSIEPILYRIRTIKLQ
jgi:hypothetical protein